MFVLVDRLVSTLGVEVGKRPGPQDFGCQSRPGRLQHRIAGQPRDFRMDLLVHAWDGFRDCTTHRQGDVGRQTVSKKGAKTPSRRDKRQFLTTMDPDVIRAIKQAALGLDRTASDVMEEAAKEWPERHRA